MWIVARDARAIYFRLNRQIPCARLRFGLGGSLYPVTTPEQSTLSENSPINYFLFLPNSAGCTLSCVDKCAGKPPTDELRYRKGQRGPPDVPILVVDDDKAVRTAIKIILEHSGFDVVVAENGRSGVEAVQRGKFDVVIVDIFMPGMDGLETIRVFNKHAPEVPVIAISGFMFRELGKSRAQLPVDGDQARRRLQPRQAVSAERPAAGGGVLPGGARRRPYPATLQPTAKAASS